MEDTEKSIEEDKKKEAELQELRAKVKKLLRYKNPLSPLEQVANAVPLLHDNPWLFIHDVVFTEKFLDELASVLQDYGHVSLDQLDTRRETLVVLAEQKRKELEQKAEGESDDKEYTNEEVQSRLVAQLTLLHCCIRDLSEFAMGQPVSNTAFAFIG